MSRRFSAIVLSLFLAVSTACGLTENEAVGLADPVFPSCPSRSYLSFEEAVERSELVVHARPTDSFFVDHCHRAFLLEVKSLWQGDLPEPVLAIVRIEPHHHVRQWVDLGLGESAIFLLEQDPEVPETFRPVGSGGVIPVDRGMAYLCDDPYGLGCEEELVDIRDLENLFDVTAFDREDAQESFSEYAIDDAEDLTDALTEDVSDDSAIQIDPDEDDLHDDLRLIEHDG